MNLMVQVGERKNPKSKSCRSGSSVNQSQDLSQLEPDMTQRSRSTAERLKRLPFGWNITFKLNAQPPFRRKEGTDEKCAVSHQKSTFTSRESITIDPPHSYEFLSSISDEEIDLLEDGEPVPRLSEKLFHPLGVIHDMVIEKFHHLSHHKNPDDGKTLLGKTSFFGVQTNKKQGFIAIAHGSDIWNDIVQKINGIRDSNNGTSPITMKLNVSHGHIAHDDTEHTPVIFEHCDSEDETFDVEKVEPKHARKDGIFSQEELQRKAPPVQPSKRS